MVRAKEYHAAAFFELKGPVKEVIMTSTNPEAVSTTDSGTLRFDENGAIAADDATYTYDDSGYIISCSANLNTPIPYTRKAIYNEDHILTGLVTEITQPIAMEVTSTNMFDNAGNVVGTTITNKLKEENWNSILPPDAIPNGSYTYSDIETDSYGNWIKRKVTVTMDSLLPSSCTDPIVKDFPQTRTILYY